MWSRLLLVLILSCESLPVLLHAAEDDWLRSVEELRSSGSKSFQVRAEIGAGPELITADISYARADHRCLILRDSFDGVPLMLAIDGNVWLYDPVGGQILLIRAEPEFLAEEGSLGPIHVSWGMRADFPDAASYTTIRLNFGAMMRSLALRKPEKMVVNSALRTAEYTDLKVTAKLTVDDSVPPRPASFSLDQETPERRTILRFSSSIYDAPVPKWHHEVNLTALSKRLPVRSVRESALFSKEVQDKMNRVKGLLRGKALFILRPALRDAELRKAFEKNSPIQINFNEVKANDEAMRDTWMKALQEQGFAFPSLKAKAAARE